MNIQSDGVLPTVTRGRALTAFTLGTLFFGYAFTQRVAPSVMTNELMGEFEVGGAALGALSAFYFYAYAGVQIPVGMLLDRLGPRKLMSGALLLCALASIGFSYSETLTTAAIGRFFIGGTVAFGFVSTLTIAGYWFPAKRFALLSGILTTVGMMGAILGQAPLRIAVETVGWRHTVALLAVIAVVLAILIFFIVPHRSPAQLASTRNSSPFGGLKAVALNGQSWLCAGIGFGMTSTLLAFSGLWAIPWLNNVKGLELSHAAGIASAAFLGWAVSAPVMGWFSDHIGRRKPGLYAGLIANIIFFTVLVFSSIQDPVVLILLFFLIGFAGSAMVISFGAVRELNAPENNATALALLNMGVVGSGAVMQPLVGWMLDLNWGGEVLNGARIYGEQAYQTALLFILGANVLALVCCISLRESYCRPLHAKQTTRQT